MNISDTNDIDTLLNENDLLLTTGYGFKENPEELSDFIIRLNNVGVCGMVIKENRFIKEIPKSAIDIANSLDFPILTLTGRTTLGELSWHITGYISDYMSNRLAHAINLQKEFNDMMLRDCSTEYLIERLSEITNVPVILLNHSFEIVTPKNILNSIYEEAVSNIISLIKSDFDKYGNVTDEIIKTKSTLKSTAFSTFNVPTTYNTPNILIVLNSTSLKHPLSNTSIEQIIYSLSFNIMKKQIDFENNLKLKSAFFFDILYGNINNISEYIKKGAKFGLRSDCKYMCITGTYDINDPYKNTSIPINANGMLPKVKALENLEKEAKKLNLDIIVFTQNNYIISLLQIDRFNSDTLSIIEKLLVNVQNNYINTSDISFGVSSYFTSLDQIKNAYLDSIEALNHGYDLQKSKFIQHYKLRDGRDILQMIPMKTLKEYSSNILGELIQTESSEKVMLLNTLKAYIDNKYDVSKTSRELFVHRNTIKYRLSRCEEILEMSLHDKSDSFNIQLALEINDIISSKEQF